MRLALIGAGAIGRTHLAAADALSGVAVCGILDPSPTAESLARTRGLTLYADMAALIADRPDGAILATPNALHLPQGLALIAAGIPVLIEKPLAADAESGARLVAAARQAGVPGLVGHHRRHNPILRATRRAIDEGRFGQLIAGSVACTLMKPDSYFDEGWRRRPGDGGPVLINLVHEIDLLRHLFGPIRAVQAVSSNARRGLAVEDTAAIILEFAQGGLVTVTVSDAAQGPWAWDLTAGENTARFPAHPVSSHLFSGTRGGFSLPDLTFWSHAGAPDWTRAMTRDQLPVDDGDSYVAQLAHFAEVIAGTAAPLVTLEDGWQNLRVIEAIHRAARSGAKEVFDLAPQMHTTGRAPSPEDV